MRRVLVALLAVAGVLAPATAASADTTPAPNSIGVRLLDAPSNRRDDPRARLYIIDHVPPGTTISRRIEVSNTTAKAADVSVYPAAASITGGIFVGADAQTPNELSTWTTVDRATLPLAPGAAQPVTVTIKVPQDAAPGERYAVVWAQLSSAPSSGENITAVNRVGIRVYLSVGPGGEPASDFAVDSLTAERTTTGQPVVKAQVHNTGGRAVDMSGTLSLSSGPAGLSAGPFPAKLGTTLAVKDTEDVSIPLDPTLPDGPWHAVITLTSGLLSRTAEATINFPKAAAPAAAPVPATPVAPGGPGGLPWGPILAGLGVLVLAVLLASIALHRGRGLPGQRRRSSSIHSESP